MEKRAGFHRSSDNGAEVIMTAMPASRVAFQKRADDKRMIRGYAAVFYRAGEPSTEYWLWDDIVERISKGAFDNVLGNDVRGLFNHNPDNLLGRSIAGNLRLSVDDVGLRYEIDEDPEDPDWKRVGSKIDRGDLTGSSFAFIAKRVSWIEEDSYWIRQIDEFSILYDVGPVTYPAYEGSTAGRSSRSDELSPIVQELNAFRRQRLDAQNELELLKLRARVLELDEAGK